MAADLFVGSSDSVFVTLPIDQIRGDGETQMRSVLRSDIIDEYRNLMLDGIEFPPISVWFDGSNYWVADGFHRLAAARAACKTTIKGYVHTGTIVDARWDSYGANASHGLRRTPEDLRTAIQCALEHPYARGLSNNQLARHLSIPEATLRRWRKRLGRVDNEEGCTVRTAQREGKSYPIRITAIGRSPRTARRPLNKTEIADGLKAIKASASPLVRSLLNVMGNWLSGAAPSDDCLAALERIIERVHSDQQSTKTGLVPSARSNPTAFQAVSLQQPVPIPENRGDGGIQA